jgi:hypothetical protein
MLNYRRDLIERLGVRIAFSRTKTGLVELISFWIICDQYVENRYDVTQMFCAQWFEFAKRIVLVVSNSVMCFNQCAKCITSRPDQYYRYIIELLLNNCPEVLNWALGCAKAIVTERPERFYFSN